MHLSGQGASVGKKFGKRPSDGRKAKCRKECKAQGPAMDETFTMRQANQPPIGITTTPVQQLVALVWQLANRNRTRRAEITRVETEGLEEIDQYATNAKHKDQVEKVQGEMTLKILRTCSAWARIVAFWSGKFSEQTCRLCQGAEETWGHLWKCSKLETKVEEPTKKLLE